MTSDLQTESPEGLPTGAALPARHRIGSFELLSVASRSSAGLVYRAWDHALARPVAIKEYLPTALALRDADLEVHPLGPACAAEFELGRAAFVDEARRLARCDHASLVRVLSLFEAGGTACCVMPWYAGRPLPEARRKMAGPIGEPALRGFLDHLLGALETYQRIGSMHLGVRPSQVLWLDDDRPLLLGPGMAGRAAQTPSLEALAAEASEAGFAPPEQALPSDEQPLGPWSDFHALAAVARYWMTGEAPSTAGKGAHEPLAATVERLFGQSPSARYSASLLNTLDAALAPDAASRPQTAAQFREALWGAPGVLPQRGGDPAASLRESDTATADWTWRVIGSIDEPGESALPPGLSDAPAVRADPADRAGPHPQQIPPLARGHPGVWAGVALAAVLAVGLGAMEWQGHPLRLSAAIGWPAAVQPLTETQAQAAAEPSGSEAARPVATRPAVNPRNASASAAVVPTSSDPLASAPAATVPTPPTAPPTSTSLTPAAGPPTKGEPAARPVASSPRQECGARTEFALYRCMQQQCSQARWRRHPQCVQLEETDTVD